jgi:hypothetical protein
MIIYSKNINYLVLFRRKNKILFFFLIKILNYSILKFSRYCVNNKEGFFLIIIYNYIKNLIKF